MQQRSFLALGPHGFHRIAYLQWGNSRQRPTLVCVHGLTRNSHDFDGIAEALADSCRVVCPDMAGRGRSDWFDDAQDYQYPVYVQDAAALLAHLGVESVDWLGTSMGGLIGMMLAAQPGTPIRRLILNDIGASIPAEALARIGSYVGKAGTFDSLANAEQYLRRVHAPFGALTDAQWRHLAENSAWRDGAGRWRLGYDPAIGTALQQAEYQDVELWDLWRAVKCPTLILRGAQSDILLEETAARMISMHSRAQVVVFPNVGHAPMLMDADQIRVVRDWLTHTQA